MSEIKTKEYVNDMNGSPGPIPIWGFCLVLMVPVVTLGIKLEINSVILISAIQCLISLLGGLWLIKLGKEGLVPIWKADIARRMFLLPTGLFLLEFTIEIAIFIWKTLQNQ